MGGNLYYPDTNPIAKKIKRYIGLNKNENVTLKHAACPLEGLNWIFRPLNYILEERKSLKSIT